MKTTCLYENEEFGNTARDILLDKKIQAEIIRATEAENKLKDNIATGVVAELRISDDNLIQLIGLDNKIVAEAQLNIQFPTSIKAISLNGTKLHLTYTDESVRECDLSTLLADLNEQLNQEKSRALLAEETLQGNIDNTDGTVAELEQRIADLEQKVAELHPGSNIQ